MHARTTTRRTTTTTLSVVAALALGVLALLPATATAAPFAPGASCATGRLVSDGPDGAPEGLPDALVEVYDIDYDDDTGNEEQLLAQTQTAADGSWRACFESSDDQGGGQELQVDYTSRTYRYVAGRTGSGDRLGRVEDVYLSDPETVDVGTTSAGASQSAMAFRALGDLYRWVDPGCIADTPEADRCGGILLLLSGEPGASTYDAGTGIATLRGTVDRSSVVRLGAQAVMDAVYDDAMPATGCTAGVFEATTPECAWVLGWADWVAARVTGDPVVAGVDLEDQGWRDGHPFGDTVPGRVAGALLDLSDPAGEAPWDRFAESAGSGAQDEPSFVATSEGLPTTFSGFFETARSGVADQGLLPRAAVYGNTINYDSRDPLTDQQSLTRPGLGVTPREHDYAMAKVRRYWGGLAIRPDGDSDYDVELYADRALTALLGSSVNGRVDYVLVDGNRVPDTVYYATAVHYAGDDPYQVEWYDGNVQAPVGVTTVELGADDVLAVRDSYLNQGTEEFFRIVPGDGLDVEAALHVSTAVQGTWAQGRDQAAVRRDDFGAGGAESFTYVTQANGWAGLVLANLGGSGTATVYRDTTAPTAQPTLAAGAATTDKRSVPLTIDGRDTETGVMDMRVAVDGVFDDEEFQPYTASQTITLPAGLGAKQVLVQVRNNAGMVSALGAASIELVAGRPEAPSVEYGAPGRPTEIALTVSPPAWDGGSPITGYRGFCTSPDGGAAAQGTASGSPFVVSGLTPGKRYRCSAAASNAHGTGPRSAPGPAVTTPAATVPDPAQILAYDVTNGAIGLGGVAYDGGSPITAWTARCVSSDGGATRVVSSATAGFRVTNLSGGKTYRCRLRATNGVGAGPYGQSIQEVVPTGAPEQPQIVSTTASAGAVTVRFSLGNNGGAPVTSYVVSCASPDGGVPRTRTVTASPAKVVDLTGGKRYRCKVRATNSAGSSAFSDPGARVAVPTGPPAPVTLTFTMIEGNALTISFSPNGNGGSPITGYTIACTSTDGGVARSVSGTASPLAVGGLTVGKTYRCRVRATNAVGAGAYGGYGPSVFITAARPREPVVTSTTAAVGAVTVRFRPGPDGGSPITSFTASCASTNGGAAGRVTGAASPLRVTGLTSGKTYRCRVLATNAQGNSNNSDVGEDVVVG